MSSVIRVKHLLGEKTSEFDNDNDFINFTKNIMMENGDAMFVNSVDDCVRYILTYCDNLLFV